MSSLRKDLLAKDEPKNKHKQQKEEQQQQASCSSKKSQNPKGGDNKRKSLLDDGDEFLKRKRFIKSSIRVDYQPDICKDFQRTGFCGFGDSCIFLHDRTDYKPGWQIEQDYKAGLYKEEDDDKYLIKDDDAEQETLRDPTLCPICNEQFKDPIVTKCKHNFCGSCAEKECSDKCYLCDKPTLGIFKVAKELIIRLKDSAAKTPSVNSDFDKTTTTTIRAKQDKSREDNDDGYSD